MVALSRARSALAAASLLLLAACASEPAEPAPVGGATGTALPPPGVGEPATPGGPAAPPPPLPEPSSTSQPPAEPAGSDAPVIVKGPDGTTWKAAPRKDKAAYQADIEDCYRFAAALTRRDAQRIDDRNAGIDTLTNQSPFAGLRQRVDEFGLRNRRTSLMSSCMESKGYARADTVLPRLEF